MAKFEGTQTIPAEWLNGYRGTLNPHPTGKIVKKRFPFRLPRMQKFGPGVSPGQLAQRGRFESARDQFNDLDSVGKSAWYDSMPEYSSLLWYYNWFMLSALMFDANLNQGGVGVIKLIQNIFTAMEPGGATYAIPTAVDPGKVVVMAWGGAHNNDADFGEGFAWAWAWICYPVPRILNSSQIQVIWSETPGNAGNIALQIVEYI